MSWIKNIERGIGGLIPHKAQADIRAERYAMREQMALYKEQKDTLQKANQELAEQKKVESDRLHEKQIRALRGKYRRSTGFMNSGAITEETKDTLG